MAKPRKILFKIYSLTLSNGYFISKHLRYMKIGFRCDHPLFTINMANI